MLAHDGDVRWAAERTMAGWVAGAVVEVLPAMRAITTGAVLRALFSEVTPEDVDTLTAAVTEVATGLWKAAAPGSESLKRTLLPGFGRFVHAREAIDAYVAGAIARRRSGEVAADDVLAVMLRARPEGGGAGMSDADARDEVVSLLLAGRGTITAGLAWTWFLLARNPEVESRVHAEVDGLGREFPEAADLDRLPFIRAVWDEALRVYPPSWVLRRKAAAGATAGDVSMPEGSTILVNVFGLHRDPRSFDDPGAFRPERFLDGRPPPFAYLPFGAGPRGCIGYHFASMEAVLLVAAIASRWRLGLVDPPAAEPRFARSITLRSKVPLRMRFAAR
jgi:cytochrome P450